jgi:hypothetical protein
MSPSSSDNEGDEAYARLTHLNDVSIDSRFDPNFSTVPMTIAQTRRQVPPSLPPPHHLSDIGDESIPELAARRIAKTEEIDRNLEISSGRWNIFRIDCRRNWQRHKQRLKRATTLWITQHQPLLHPSLQI